MALDPKQIEEWKRLVAVAAPCPIPDPGVQTAAAFRLAREAAPALIEEVERLSAPPRVTAKITGVDAAVAAVEQIGARIVELEAEVERLREDRTRWARGAWTGADDAATLRAALVRIDNLAAGMATTSPDAAMSSPEISRVLRRRYAELIRDAFKPVDVGSLR